ncbi:MAG: hypothetical protein H6748_02700 [Spirochaetaceae bacterium]|nr:hypothetical protein [Myxococcales bacterium]MCB9722935.1 hypothetical protein [Spirochaetaceae bacterium]
MSGQGVLPSRRVFFIRLARQALLSGAIVAFSLALGAAGYHEFVGLPWLDATLNASMILTGMGPVAPLETPAAKLFGIFYSLFSGVAFLGFATVLIAPVAQRFLHRLHLDMAD